MLEQARQAGLVLLLSLACDPGPGLTSLALPVFSRSHAQPDVDLSRPPEIKLHHQANLSVATGNGDTSIGQGIVLYCSTCPYISILCSHVC